MIPKTGSLKNFFSYWVKYQVLLGTWLFFFQSIHAQSNLTSPDTGKCLFGNCSDGVGEKLYPDNSRFVGLFELGNKKSGAYIYPNGDLYYGAFDSNKRIGNARYQYKNGNVFSGWYNNDEKEFGRFQQNGGPIYEGTWKDNKPHGYGKITTPDGVVWEGVFEEGEKQWGAVISGGIAPLDTADLGVKLLSGEEYTRSSETFPRVFAVVVGLSNYTGTSADLSFSDDDARLFHQYLIMAMPRETKSGKVALLLNEQATASNIKRTIRETFSQSTENDIILFYFSGHGSESGLIPFEIYNPIPHEEIRAIFRTSNAAYRLCIADACYSGAMNQGNAQNLFIPLSNLSDAKIAVIMSSKPSQTSSENNLFRQGVFSYFLVKGLKGSGDLNRDSYVTAAELFLYTKNKVTQYSSGRQVPVISGNNLHRIPLAKIVR